MKKTPRHFVIPLVIYPFDVVISINQTDDQLWEVIKFTHDKFEDCEELWNMHPTTTGRSVMTQSNLTVIRLKPLGDKVEEAAVIAHEVFHAVTFIMELIGIELKVMISDEAYAYLIGYITKEIYKKLW